MKGLMHTDPTRIGVPFVALCCPIFDRELSFSFAFFRPLVGNFLFSLLLSSDLWPRTFYFSLFLLKHICSLTVNGSSFLGDTFVPSFVGKKEKIPILGQGLWPMS